jgi:uncharacterized membrane protein YuzA (DUF378 family)
MMKNRNVLDVITIVLLLVGGVLWGILGLFGMELLGCKAGSHGILMSPFFRIIYVLVGLSALYRTFLFGRNAMHK